MHGRVCCCHVGDLARLVVLLSETTALIILPMQKLVFCSKHRLLKDFL
jgi:hypothetical protein